MAIMHPVAVDLANQLLGRVLDLLAQVNALADRAGSRPELEDELWTLISLLDDAAVRIEDELPRRRPELLRDDLRSVAIAGWRRSRGVVRCLECENANK